MTPAAASDHASTSAASRPPARPRLLVSVRDAAEARAALDGGADIIDVKEPAHGSLGAAAPGTLRSVIAAIAGARPVSAALGELVDHLAPRPRGPSPAQASASEASPCLDPASLPPGLAFCKLGLASAPSDWSARLARLVAPALARQPAPGAAIAAPRFIAAAYADAHRAAAPAVADVLAWALQHHAAGLLIDTFIKDGQGLFAWLSEADLLDLIARARANGLLIALAGSLADDAFLRAAALRPDIVAVRGGACTGRDRAAAIDPARVAQLARSLQAIAPGSAH